MIIDTLEVREALTAWIKIAEHLGDHEDLAPLVEMTRKARESIGALDAMVAIPKTAFLGEGKIPHLISGRVSGDDDDTACLVLGNGTDEEDIFIESLAADDGLEMVDGRPVDEDGDPVDIFIIQNTQLTAS